MDANTLFYGLDLGLRRGALCSLDLRPEGIQVSFLPWTCDERPSRTTESTLLAHIRLMNDWLAGVEGLGHPAAGDWSLNEVMMPTNRRQAALKAFLAGLYTATLTPKVIISWVEPAVLRKALGLKATTPKAEVHKLLGELLPSTLIPIFERTDEHQRDALLLALYAASHYIEQGPMDLFTFIQELP